MLRTRHRALLAVVVALVVPSSTLACASGNTDVAAPGTTSAVGSPASTSAPVPPADDPSAPTTTPTTAAATTPAAPPASETPTSAAPGAPRSFPVGTHRTTFVDAGRQRTLVTTIYYPAGNPGAGRAIGVAPRDATAGAAPAAGPFPLVLMAHGYRLPGDGYDRIMKTVASAGYVVAAPEFPHNTAHGGDGLRSDITNQPADMTFVADQLISRRGALSGRTPAIDEPAGLGAVGHSDGGLTVTAFGYNEQFRDDRVRAVASLTGGTGLFPGAYFTGRDLPALLVAHAVDDSTNRISASENLYAALPAGSPKWFMSMERGDHIEPYMFGSGRIELGDALTAFLDVVLKGDGAAEARLRAAASTPGFSLRP